MAEEVELIETELDSIEQEDVWARYKPGPMEGWVFIPESTVPARVRVPDDAEAQWVVATNDGKLHVAPGSTVEVDTTMEG